MIVARSNKGTLRESGGNAVPTPTTGLLAKTLTLKMSLRFGSGPASGRAIPELGVSIGHRLSTSPSPTFEQVYDTERGLDSNLDEMVGRVKVRADGVAHS